MDTDAERLLRIIRPRLNRIYRDLAELRRLVAQLSDTTALPETPDQEDTNGDDADTEARLGLEPAAAR